MAARRAGGEVSLIAAVGQDALGTEALAEYQEEGLDVRYLRVVPGAASGVALIFVGDGGENMIGVAPGANARLSPEDIDGIPDDVFAAGAVLLASLEVPLAAVARGLRRARRRGMTTVLNPAPADPGVVDRELLGLVDYLTPNREEAQGLVPGANGALAAAATLRDWGAGSVVVTLGSEGCLVATGTGVATIAAPAVRAVDTVGAGDAFNGALAVALAEGRPVVEAATWACAAGALAVTRTGAQTALPRREEIERMAATMEPPRIVKNPCLVERL
jgi:ribokinase